MCNVLRAGCKEARRFATAHQFLDRCAQRQFQRLLARGTRRVARSAFLCGGLIVAAVLATAAAGNRPQAPPSAADILARSLAAHGGDRLSSWQTLTIDGTIEMEDGITYRAAYRVRAKQPGKLKVEQDMTVDRGGRYFYEYFRNGDQVWGRRNLIVTQADPRRLDRWMNQCYGIAYYVKQATAAILKPDAASDWLSKSGTAYQVTEQRPAHVVSVTMAGGSADLYIDPKTFYLLEERTADVRRIYSAFRDFAGAVHPARILEVTRGRNGEVITPITYESVRYDAPIEDWIFEEDRPKK